MIAQKLQRIQMVMPEVNLGNGGFEPVNLFGEANVMDPADILSADFAQEDGANVSSVMKASDFVKEVSPEPVYEGPTPEELIEQAKEEIEKMRADAMSEMDSIRVNTINSARAQGYEEGRKQAMQEMEAARHELEMERMHLQAHYEQQIDELEPLFIQTLTGIYEKVFEVGLDNQQEIIVNLLRNTMKKLDGCKNFLVHVSAADYQYVKEHKEELLSDSTQEGTVIDIVEDSMIRENECTIETINGIYDCGIGTQMKELRKKLTLLSYNGRQES
jgi:flagellar assembly protein FliH